jgi:3-methylcrotonyl-CoA carboxylase alpha subunit
METKMIETRYINKVLVANRGEIAVRIFNTLHQMGICTVAVYADADAEALHCRMAVERHLLKGNTLAETYLNAAQLIEVAKSCDADAIHPGYGFLSENPDFAQAVTDAGLIFIGPQAEAIRKMGNKKEARAIANKLGIPVAEGAEGSNEVLVNKAREIGYPVMVKAAAGGGGKGMRIVWAEEQLEEVLEATQREALKYFGDSDVYIEKFLPAPRHIEVQVLADKHGNVLSLFERECSLQRRHQKIIEEAPAPNIPESLRHDLYKAARSLAKHINYESAGTVEFLVQDDRFFFLEMNTRIQVEHPVTEMITGIDIVKEQMNIASVRPLKLKQDDISLNGHAIEARLYAEDPDNNFLPSPGNILLHKAPFGKRLRIDSALDGPAEVSSMYDPMISKVIFHGGSRETARKKMIQHLKDYVILGVKTNTCYLVELLTSKPFIEGKTHTRLIDESPELFTKNCTTTEKDKQLLAMAYMFINSSNCNDNKDTWQHIGHWRLLPTASLLINGEAFNQDYIYHTPVEMSIQNDNDTHHFRLLEQHDHKMLIEVGGITHTVYYLAINGEVLFQVNAMTSTVKPVRYLGRDILSEINENPVLEGESLIKAPMHGTVIKVLVQKGDPVNKGDTLLILESMKMENKISATAKAYVKNVAIKAGDVVANNSPMIQLTNNLV